MDVVFVVARMFANSRDFLRAAAQTPSVRVGLVKGDASPEDALPLLARADRVWFEGAGPLARHVLGAAASGRLPPTVLRVDDEDLRGLPLQDAWRVVSDLVVPTAQAAEAVRRAAPPPKGRGRIHVAVAATSPAATSPAAPTEDLRQLADLLPPPRADLGKETWQQIIHLGGVCRGDVLVVGPAPAALFDYLETALACRALTADPPDGGRADVLLFWHSLTRRARPEGAALIARALKPGGTVIAVAGPYVTPDAIPATEMTRLLAEAAPAGVPMTAQARHGVATLTPAQADPAPPPAPRVEVAPESPLVSVVIFVYNRADCVGRCIASHLRQTYPHLEIVVVDDGSTDGTADVVKPYLADPRVRYFRIEHQGRPAARNFGIRQARGTYIAWIGSDDESLPGRLAAQVEAARTAPPADIVYADAVYLNPDETLQRYRRFSEFTEDALPGILLRRGPMTDGSLLVRRDLYDRVGLYDESFPRAQDTEFYARCAICGGLTYRYIPVPLIRAFQKPLGRPEVLPSLRDAYGRIVLRLIDHFGLDRLVDERGRARGEDPRVNVSRVLVNESMARKAPADYPLLGRARAYLEAAAADAAPADRAEALALLAGLADAFGDSRAAEDLRGRARRADASPPRRHAVADLTT